MKSLHWSLWQNKGRLRRSLLLACLCWPLAGRAEVGTFSLEQLLKRAEDDSESLHSIELSLESAQAEIAGRDFELSTQLVSHLSQVQDNRATFQPGRRSLSRLMDVSLVKPFSSGTTVSATSSYELADVANIGNRHIATWELTLSQSLWRNFFGRSTSLRRQADSQELKARELELLQRRQTQLMNIETLYWDLALALREEEIKTHNLETSTALRAWISDRIRRSAAEETDRYQIDALIASRKLELTDVRDRIATLRLQLSQLIPGLSSANWTPHLKDLEQTREINSLIAPRNGGNRTVAPVRLDAIASAHRRDQSKALAERESDSLAPLLDFGITHGRNGIQNQFGSAWQSSLNAQSGYTKVGFTFAMELDGEAKDDRRRALLLQAQAQDLEAKRLARESELGWKDLGARVVRLQDSVTSARRAYEAQSLKSKEESTRYRQGRSTAFQTISFELEAAQTEVQVFQLLNSLRKAEAQARMFTYTDGGTP